MLPFHDATCDWSHKKKDELIGNSSVVEQWLSVETKDDRRMNRGDTPVAKLWGRGFIIVTPILLFYKKKCPSTVWDLRWVSIAIYRWHPHLPSYSIIPTFFSNEMVNDLYLGVLNFQWQLRLTIPSGFSETAKHFLQSSLAKLQRSRKNL